MGLALQLLFRLASESMGNHDSEVMGYGMGINRDDAGDLGVIVAGCKGADASAFRPGAGRSIGERVS